MFKLVMVLATLAILNTTAFAGGVGHKDDCPFKGTFVASIGTGAKLRTLGSGVTSTDNGTPTGGGTRRE